MKRLFITLIMAVAMITTQPTQAATSSYTAHGDTATIIDGTDTVVITSKVAGLVEKIAQSNILEHLDDTIVDNNKDNDYNYEDNYNESKENETFIEINRTWSHVAREVAAYTGLSVVFIVFFVLFFRYANRRRKYKVLEKAIENNYQLPDGVFSDKASKVVYMNKAPYAPAAPVQGTPAGNGAVEGTPVPPPYRSYDSATAQQPAAGPTTRIMNEQVNWHEIKGVGAVAAGLGGIIFGFATNATPLVGIFCIPLFIGAFKMWASYMEQRNAIIVARQYAQAQQPQQQAQQQAQQPTSGETTPPQL